ncbi:MAG: hydrogenase 4 subunit F [Nitrospirota bacterium]|nr:hydrogenase 4 subunit F [Nitrospirota bacterium]
MLTVLLIPIITAVLCYLVKSPRFIGYVSLAGMSVLVVAAARLIAASLAAPVYELQEALFMDAFSAYVMALMLFYSFAAAVYSISYLQHEFETGLIDIRGMRRYYGLFHLFVFTMLLVVAANNLALMWIGMEATTIVSALLIGLGFHKRPLAVEAAWKYIVLCTVGITFALLGTFITYYAASSVVGHESALNWTVLSGIAAKLNPGTMKLAFIFMLVGYGTKAGLAPVHNWLPDAQSQAPSPISALLPGWTAFYAIMRFLAIVSPSTGVSFTGNLLVIFGLISIGIAAIFIVVQDNYKRLLSYSSVEHMGIMALGVGIGGPLGFYGSLLHMLGNTFAKPLMFFTSGKIQARFGSTNIANVTGVFSSMPLLGAMTFIGALALAGSPPFNIFISEFTILKAAADKGMWLVLGIFLFFAAVVFYGVLSGFGKMLFGDPGRESGAGSLVRPRIPVTVGTVLGNGIMIAMTASIVVMGFTIPQFIDRTIRACIAALGAN